MKIEYNTLENLNKNFEYVTSTFQLDLSSYFEKIEKLILFLNFDMGKGFLFS